MLSGDKSSDAYTFRLIVLMCDCKMPLNFSYDEKKPARRAIPQGSRLRLIAANPALTEQGVFVSD